MGLEASVKIDMDNVLDKAKAFVDEFKELCNEYGFTPGIAEDGETGDKYICVSMKDLITENDISVDVKRK